MGSIVDDDILCTISSFVLGGLYRHSLQIKINYIFKNTMLYKTLEACIIILDKQIFA